MKMLWVGLILASAAFAQSDPNNLAAESLKKRVLGMDLLNPPKRFVLPQQHELETAAKPKICSIPLLNAIPPGTSDSMKVQQPKAPRNPGDYVEVPAPPCPAPETRLKIEPAK